MKYVIYKLTGEKCKIISMLESGICIQPVSGGKRKYWVTEDEVTYLAADDNGQDVEEPKLK